MPDTEPKQAYQFQPQELIDLRLETQHINVILTSLGSLPYNQSAPVIQAISDGISLCRERRAEGAEHEPQPTMEDDGVLEANTED